MSANGNNQRKAASSSNPSSKSQKFQNNNNNNNNTRLGKGKAQIQKKRQATKMQVRATSSVSKSVYDYAQRLVDPEGTEAVLSPCPISCRALAIKKKLILDMNTAYDATSGAGNAFGYINADPDNLLELSTTLEDDLDENDLTYFVTSSAAGADSSKENSVIDSNGATGNHNQFSVVGAVSAQSATSPSIPINIEAATDTFSFTVSHKAAGRTLRIELWAVEQAPPFVAAKKIWSVEVPPNAQVAISALALSTAALALNVFFKCSGPGVRYTVTQKQQTGKHRLQTGVASTVKHSLDLFESIPGAEYYRITAMGVLGTYMGSDQANGGRLAAGKVSKFWRPKTSNALDELADLPNDVHQGALKTGFHLHWVPSSPGELSPTGISEKVSHLSRFAFALDAADVAQSFRLQITCHVEYFTTESLYGSMNFTPEPYGLGTMIAYLNQKVPVATENDLHLIKKALEHVKSAGRSGLRWVLDHPEELARAAAYIASAI